MLLNIVGECDLQLHLSDGVTSRPHTKFISSGKYGKPRELLVFGSEPEPGTYLVGTRPPCLYPHKEIPLSPEYFLLQTV